MKALWIAAALAAACAAVGAAQAADPAERPWRLDVGGEYSVFTRRPQPDWMLGYAQLARTDFARNYSVYGRVDGYRQFELNDLSLETGLYGRLREGLYGAVQVGYTPAADFKPDWRVAGDVSTRLYKHRPSAAEAWLLLAGWYDVYDAADPIDVTRFAAGLRLAWREDWALSGHATTVNTGGSLWKGGWKARADAPVIPSRLRVHLGAADAPETVDAFTVDTFSLFGGLALDLENGRTVNLGYSRDDRENAYIRHAFNASLSQRF